LEIFPSEVEDCLSKNENIVEVIVFGVPINDYEQITCAWVVLKKEKEVTIDELKQFCSGKISDYKIPQFIKIVDKMIVNNIGKYSRKDMIEKYKDELESLKLINL
jgi:acyl-CoA synthetase (AMP-forming)/AMP-acid ligase II